MPKESFTVKKENEFFISVAKKGIHSFMMVGVIDNGGSPRMLARVGKTNYIDSDADNPLKMTIKTLGDGTLARIAVEGVIRRANYSENIEYSAYSINYEQAKEFLGLIAQIEKSNMMILLLEEQLRIVILPKKRSEQIYHMKIWNRKL